MLKKDFSLIKTIKNLRKKTLGKKDLPDDLFIACPGCKSYPLRESIRENFYICPACSYHFDMPAGERIRMVFDSYKILNEPITYRNPIEFPDYEKKLKEHKKKSGQEEGIIILEGEIGGIKLISIVMNKDFMMASMGVYLGDQIVRAFKLAEEKSLPLLAFVASGGARMQEGIYSLMQMARTNIQAKSFLDSGNLYISCLTNPSTGGVLASFASLGDITIAEPNSLIGFAGPRVIKQTINQDLPEGFQSSDFLLEHGFLDSLVDRRELKDYLYKILSLHKGG